MPVADYRCYKKFTSKQSRFIIDGLIPYLQSDLTKTEKKLICESINQPNPAIGYDNKINSIVKSLQFWVLKKKKYLEEPCSYDIHQKSLNKLREVYITFHC